MEKELRILILEDVPLDAELAHKELKKFLKNFTVKVVETEKGFIQALDEFKPDLIISDYHLPAFDGLAALKIAREKSPLIPFIIFTGSINEETAVECIQAGADDYVIKENIIRLAPAVLGAIEKNKNEQERLNAIQALRESEVKYRNLFTQIADPVFVFAKKDHCFLDCNQSALDRYGYTLEELRKMTPHQLHHSEEQAEVNQRIGDEFDTSLHLYTHLTKGGQDIQVEVSTVPIEYEGQEAWISIVRDITERVQSEREISRFSRIFEDSLNEIYLFNADTLKFTQVNNAAQQNLGYSLEELQELTPLDIQPEFTTESFSKIVKPLQNDDKKVVFGTVHKRKDGSLYDVEVHLQILKHDDTTLFAAIVLDITERKRVEQEKDDLLQQVQVANERLRALSRELINSQEEERKRISRELHDEFGQALTAITLDLDIIERDLDPKTPQDIKNRLSDTRIIAIELDEKIGELALDLRPSLLDDLGLLPALKWYLERWSKRAEVKVEIESIGKKKRLPSEIETAIYRITQETLTNVAKHANAKNVCLHLKQGKKSVNLRIEDDGRGFDFETMQNQQVPPKGLGLIGMEDRISLIGGQIEIHSKSGEGTRIEIEIPL